MILIELLFGLGAGVVGFLVIPLFVKTCEVEGEDVVEKKCKEVLVASSKESEKVLVEAEKNARQEKIRAEENIKLIDKQIKREEENILSKKNFLKRKEEKTRELVKVCDEVKNEINVDRKEMEVLGHKMVERLLKKTGKSVDEVKKTILNGVDIELQQEGEVLVQKTEEALKEDLERTAKRHITDIIQKYAKESSVDKRYAIISVPKDNIKGRLVGDDGKNILYFEEKTETTVVFNDAPNTIIISHYNLLKQEIAYLAMKKLIMERVIDESVIDKALVSAEKEVAEVLLKIGKDVAKKMDLKEYPDDFLRLIGRLKFRTSFGQNILDHSFEVAAFGRMIAGEIGADIREVELACFFHDIGKSIDQDENRPHDVLSKEILEKYGFSEHIVYAAYAHHDAVPAVRPVDFIVKAADAISAGRPGARQETLEKYLEKIRALEGIATSEEGVEKAFAISAGREVRVIVNSVKVDDEHVKGVADRIARNVEEGVVYPGKIKINVIRRTEAVDYVNKKSSKK